MYCPACGHQNPAGARFCAGCGKPLPGAEQAATTEVTAEPQVQSAAAPVAQPVTEAGGQVAPDQSVARPGQSRPASKAYEWIYAGAACVTMSVAIHYLIGLVGVYFGYMAYKAGSKVGGISIMVLSGLATLLGLMIRLGS
jgi:hypothetical protein